MSEEGGLDISTIKVQLCQAYYHAGAIRVRSVPSGQKGIRNDLLPEPPSFEQRESTQDDLQLRNFEPLLAAVPGMDHLAQSVTQADMLESRLRTGMAYKLFGFRVKLPIDGEVVLTLLGFIYGGISARASDEEIKSMLLRLVEEGIDHVPAAEAAQRFYELHRESSYLAETLAALRPADPDDEAAAEKARLAAAEVSGGSCTRALRCAAQAHLAHQAGCAFLVVQLPLRVERLNGFCDLRRTLRRHETLTLILGMLLPLLLKEDTRGLVVNTLVSLLDIPDKALSKHKSLISLAWEKVRLPEDSCEGPVVPSDLVTRSVFEMAATHLKDSDFALYEEIAARSCGLYGVSNVTTAAALSGMVYRKAGEIFKIAANKDAKEAETLRALAAEAALKRALPRCELVRFTRRVRIGGRGGLAEGKPRDRGPAGAAAG